jgi:hypothetical protein
VVYFMAIWVNFEVIWYIIARFGMFYQKISGNPALIQAV